MPDSTTATATKTCSACGQRKPVEEFRRRRRGNDAVRHVWCRPCYLDYQKLQRIARRHEKAQRAIYAAARRDRDDAAIAGLIRETMRQVGGVDAFVGILKANLNAAAGSERAMRTLAALLRLIAAMTSRRRSTLQEVLSGQAS